MRFVLLIGWLSLGYGVLYAQTDTVYLEAVEIQDSWYLPFTTGANVKSVDTENTSTLDGALTGLPSIYFKTYGNGQLSSIAFRGTTAGHTAVLWHGIPANYPTLGEMDFSQWSSWFLQSVSVQPGSAGALYGNGAIGGTVFLDSRDGDIAEASPLQLKYEVGSYGWRFGGVKTRYGSGRWTGVTNVFWCDLENDFKYEYQGETYTQRNAAVGNYGFQQKLQYQKGNQSILLDAVYTENDREIQPNKSNTISDHTLETSNLRVALVQQIDNSSYSWNSTLAVLRNSTLYDDSLRTTATQISASSIYAFELMEKVFVRLGGNANYYVANSSNYANQVYDFQTGIFTSASIQWLRWWKTSVNLRQSFYLKRAPSTPSIGNEIIIVSDEIFALKSQQQFSFGFRYPTLNQLYWSPGGNPDLKYERSRSAEVGLRANWKKKQAEAELSLTGFQTWSDDWIYWVSSGGVSTPRNLRDVVIKGVELDAGLGWDYANLSAHVGGSYSYNQSRNQSGLNRGNQLIYVPLHAGGVNGDFRYRYWHLRAESQTTGLRYTTLDNSVRNSVEAFNVVNCSFSRTIDIQQNLALTLGLQVKNLLDEEYENYGGLAMPGRNYSMNLLLKL